MASVCRYCTVDAQNYMVCVAVKSVGRLHWLRDQAERNGSPAMPEAAQTVLLCHQLRRDAAVERHGADTAQPPHHLGHLGEIQPERQCRADRAEPIEPRDRDDELSVAEDAEGEARVAVLDVHAESGLADLPRDVAACIDQHRVRLKRLNDRAAVSLAIDLLRREPPDGAVLVPCDRHRQWPAAGWPDLLALHHDPAPRRDAVELADVERERGGLRRAIDRPCGLDATEPAPQPEMELGGI